MFLTDSLRYITALLRALVHGSVFILWDDADMNKRFFHQKYKIIHIPQYKTIRR
jgi:hypothetical protein